MVQTTCPICDNPISPADSVCPSCGFKLLGSTQQFQPINLEDSDVAPTGELNAAVVPAQQQATLRIVRGPQTEMVFQLGADPLTIGRSPQCDIFLNDMTVSREHAAINPTAEGYRIHDLNSYNGIWINNENIGDALLTNEDIVQIGAFLLVFNCD